jgi:hypothetical protein
MSEKPFRVFWHTVVDDVERHESYASLIIDWTAYQEWIGVTITNIMPNRSTSVNLSLTADGLEALRDEISGALSAIRDIQKGDTE